jgi:hypothetical protein
MNVKLNYDIRPDSYPPVSELMIALQDEGQETFNKKGARLLTYKIMNKFSKKLHEILVERNINALDSNVFRGTKNITNHLIMLRRMVDTSSVYPPLRKYSKGDENKIYIIENSIEHGGYQQLLDRIIAQLDNKVVKSGGIRNANDALRVCGLLLAEKYRSSVAGIMKNKKDRVQCDLPQDPIDSFCEEAVNDFNDSSFIIEAPPDVFEIEGYEDMNLNDPSRIKIARTGK